MPLVNLSITYVNDFHADEKPIEYNVRFTVARCPANIEVRVGRNRCAPESRISDQSEILGNPAYGCCRNGSFTSPWLKTYGVGIFC